MTKTLGELFCGGGGFTTGAVAAGLTPVWSVDADADAAQVYARNFGPHCIVSSVEDVDYSTLQTPFHLHASPSCKKASVANKERGETAEDISAAEATARAIRTLQSPNFTLENVWGYREFESFKIICRALEESGYAFNFWHLNSADYGVPQTRKRLILLASKTHRPHRPVQTHSECPSAQIDLFRGEPLLKWNGWYRAIEDLIPTLPVAKKDRRLKEPCEWDIEGGTCRDGICRGHFARWQLDRLTEGLFESSVVEATAGGVDNKFTMPVRPPDEPIFTVRPGPNIPRALIFAGDNASSSSGRGTIRSADEPCFTYAANSGEGRYNPTRAFLAHGTSTMGVRDASEPSACVVATVHGKAAKPRASDSSAPAVPIRTADEPTVTVNTHTQGHVRGRLSQGRVVSMTPRALARFQSIPDSFVLPDKAGLACKVIGNAIPSLLARRMVESLELKNAGEVAA